VFAVPMTVLIVMLAMRIQSGRGILERALQGTLVP
jgi:hypothetical protein